MLGLQIQKKDHSSVYASISMALVIFSAVLGIWVGPVGIFCTSSIGLLVAIVGFLKAPTRRFSIVLAGGHIIILLAGFGLQSFFLTPLGKQESKFPPLQNSYVDPMGFFSLRGPDGWDYQDLGSAREAGVRIRPSAPGHYVGVSEILVYIRELESKPKSQEQFLKTMAEQWAQKSDKKRELFSFSVEPANLLNRDRGLWSTLDAKRFWIPVRHVSLMGIKNKKYLCSVSAIGLKNHATLSRVFCLGIFETINITSP